MEGLSKLKNKAVDSHLSITHLDQTVIGKKFHEIDEQIKFFIEQFFTGHTAHLAMNTVRTFPLLLLSQLFSHNIVTDSFLTGAKAGITSVLWLKPDLLSPSARQRVLHAVGTACLYEGFGRITSEISPNGAFWGGMNLALGCQLFRMANQAEKLFKRI